MTSYCQGHKESIRVLWWIFFSKIHIAAFTSNQAELNGATTWGHQSWCNQQLEISHPAPFMPRFKGQVIGALLVRDNDECVLSKAGYFLGGVALKRGTLGFPWWLVFATNFGNRQGLFAGICSAALRNTSGSSTEDPLQCSHFCLRYNRHLERFAGDVLHRKFFSRECLNQ